MSRHATISAFVLLSLVLFMPSAWPQATQERLSFQGRLTDDTGNPVTGSPDITFSLYTTASGGSSIWSETQLAVPVSGGIYQVFLGDVDTTLSSLAFDTQYYLGINVAGDGEMTPRYRLSASPYALFAKRAGDADTLDGLDSAAFALANGTGDGYIRNTTTAQTADFNITGGGTIGGLLQANGNATLGDAGTDTLTINATTTIAARNTTITASNSNNDAGGNSLYINILSDEPADADWDSGLVLVADAGSSSSLEAFLVLYNASTTLPVEKGLLIFSDTGGITTGIDISGSNIGTALSIGSNVIAGNDAVIDFNNFDVDGTGAVTATSLTLSGSVSASSFTGGDAVIDFNNFDVSGAGAVTALSLSASGTVTAAAFSGDGSALTAVDSDTLDGQEGSYYLDLSNHTGTLSLASGGTGATAFTAGSVVFSNGTALAQDNANFYWDDVGDRLGIGTAPATAKLDVSSTSGHGIYGHTSSTSGRGVYGYASAGSSSADGVYGRSDSTGGRGIVGWATAGSGSTNGVWGQSDSTGGRGVVGWTTAGSGTTHGVWGQSNSTDGLGIYGYASSATGTTYGVYGDVVSSDGWGLYTPDRLYAGGNVGIGTLTPATKLHVAGTVTATSFSGDGSSVSNVDADLLDGLDSTVIPRLDTANLFATGTQTIRTGNSVNVGLRVQGETGQTGNLQEWADSSGATRSCVRRNGTFDVSTPDATNGIKGVTAETTATGAIISVGVEGQAASDYGFGLRGFATSPTGTTYGVWGSSSSPAGNGVYGTAPTTGIYGNAWKETGTSHGVYGTATSPAGFGLYGTAPTTGVFGRGSAGSGTNYGVYGESFSPDGYGVYGTNQKTGVYGTATTGSGVTYGVYGDVASASGFGLYTPDNARVEGTHSAGSFTYTSPQTRYYSIPPQEFTSMAPHIYTYIATGPWGTTGAVNFFAPIHLPQSARLTDIKVWVKDNNAGYDVTVVLASLATGSPPSGASTLLTASTSGADSDWQEITLTPAGSLFFTPSTSSYYIRVAMQGEAGTDHQVGSAKITYTVDTPLP